jgi:stage II sporulation protein AA (anti-sigma F factor antagonist)
MAEALLAFRLGQNGTAETLYVTGELDVASAPALAHAVAHAIDGQGGEFRLDISGLTFMDSTGAGGLLHVHNRVEALGRRLVVVSPTPAARRVIDLMGLDQVLDVRDGDAPA